LIDQKEKPFLVLGDSAWSLIAQVGDKEIDQYLDDRAKRGFNSLIVNLIEHKFCTNVPATRAKIAPFQKMGDFSTGDHHQGKRSRFRKTERGRFAQS